MFLLALGVATAAPFALLGVAAALALRSGAGARAGRLVAAAALPLAIAAHPLVQPLYLEARDVQANRMLEERARAASLVGKPAAAVTAALGPPDAVRGETPRVHTLDGRVAWEGETRTVWEYRPLRYYWTGSRLEVRFKDGVVAELRPGVD
jgi:hypothetical protein